MTIEKVGLGDVEELLDIYTPYVKDTAISFEYVVPGVQEFQDRISSISAKYPYIKAVEDGKILGYAYAGSFKGRAAYDWSVETTIYVRQECRRKGVGRKLYEALEASLKDMGVLNMNACIASPTKEGPYLTDDSIRFHERMGFKVVGTFHDSGYKFNQWFDMIWMEKMLGGHEENQPNVGFGKWKLVE